MITRFYRQVRSASRWWGGYPAATGCHTERGSSEQGLKSFWREWLVEKRSLTCKTSEIKTLILWSVTSKQVLEPSQWFPKQMLEPSKWFPKALSSVMGGKFSEWSLKSQIRLAFARFRILEQCCDGLQRREERLKDEFHAAAPQQRVASGPGHPLRGRQNRTHQVVFLNNMK